MTEFGQWQEDWTTDVDAYSFDVFLLLDFSLVLLRIHLLCNGKYNCMADLLYGRFGLSNFVK